jgi:hypothetical protein
MRKTKNARTGASKAVFLSNHIFNFFAPPLTPILIGSRTQELDTQRQNVHDIQPEDMLFHIT